MKKKNKYLYKGYCCNFFLDRNNDKFLKDSFIFKEKLPIMYEHKILIGYSNKLLENNIGLYVEFYLFSNIKKIFSYKLSIGFKCLEYFFKNNIRYISKAELLEISLVKNPSQFNTYYF